MVLAKRFTFARSGTCDKDLLSELSGLHGYRRRWPRHASSTAFFWGSFNPCSIRGKLSVSSSACWKGSD